MLFKKILIANRGEIALRIIRTCKELGIKTVAVYSEADKDSLHVRFADEAVCIGPYPSRDSYLKMPTIISAAQITGAEAIHPGYGFLSENAQFSDICAESKIEFIGPTANMIRLMGDKAEAKKTMKEAGVPVVPGSDGPVKNAAEAKRVAAEIGYPVLVKAVAGGGGKGMRIVESEAQLDRAYTAAHNEAESSFGNGELYVEKLIESPHHVEIQVMGTHRGEVYHYGERDCSIQRRHQKLIEESPSPIVDEGLREKMGEAAVRGAQSLQYEGAGTIEFLVDIHGNFYFIEMNTRIQVEHPVTESVYGVDLIKQQILVASGEEIDTLPGKPRGHAIEFRINAEDPSKNFRPSPGKVESLHFPGGFGIRIDSHIYQDYIIPSFYDSMIAKLIVWGTDRPHAIIRAERALEEFTIEGVHTTIPFHLEVLKNEMFKKGTYDTSFIDYKLQK